MQSVLQAPTRRVCPQLIIGLGGTGQAVVAGIQRRIVTQHGSLDAVPWVSFLCIDTQPIHWDALPGGQPRPHDLVPLQADPGQVVGLARDPQAFPHLTRWLSPALLASLGSGLRRGLSPIRALGRLAYFLNRDRISHAVQEALAQLRPPALTSRLAELGLERDTYSTAVTIVASLAGGTGSGMFLDLAYEVQSWMGSEAPAAGLTGVFLLPGAEASAAERANALAALVELNHYLWRDTEFTAQYLPGGAEFRTTEPPFRYCSLIEPDTPRRRFEGQELVEVVGHHLYLTATTELGEALSAQQREWMAPHLAPSGRAPEAYGSFGLAALTFPRRQVIEECAVRLAAQALASWLARVPGAGADGVPPEGTVRRQLADVGLQPEPVVADLTGGEAGRSFEARLYEFRERAEQAARDAPPGAERAFVDEQAKALEDLVGRLPSEEDLTRLPPALLGPEVARMQAASRSAMEGRLRSLGRVLEWAADGARDPSAGGLAEVESRFEAVRRQLAEVELKLRERHHPSSDTDQLGRLVLAREEAGDALDRAARNPLLRLFAGKRRAACVRYAEAICEQVLYVRESCARRLAGSCLRGLVEEMERRGQQMYRCRGAIEERAGRLEMASREAAAAPGDPVGDWFQSYREGLWERGTAAEGVGEVSAEAIDGFGGPPAVARLEESEVDRLVAAFRSAANDRFDRIAAPSPLSEFLAQQRPEQVATLLEGLRRDAQPLLRLSDEPPSPDALQTARLCVVGLPPLERGLGPRTLVREAVLERDSGHEGERVVTTVLSRAEEAVAAREWAGFPLRRAVAVRALQLAAEEARITDPTGGYTRTDVEWRPILPTGPGAGARAPEAIRSLAELRVRNCLLKISDANLISLDVDAIVCSRDRSLRAGLASDRSVHGAIQRAGGSAIEEEAARQGPIEQGEIRVTSAGALQADHVVHAGVIDDLTGQPVTTKVLVRAMRAVLDECQKREWDSVAVPLMGTRAGGLSQDEAVEAMFDEAYARAVQGGAYPKVVVFSLRGFSGLARLVTRFTELRERAAQAPEDGEQPLVFISAKNEDYAHAQELYEYLVGQGVRTFFSKESLPRLGDSDYRREIDRALDAAQHMVVVTTSRANVESSWVEAEWGLFINEKRSGHKKGNLVSLAVGGLQPRELPPSLRYYEVIPAGPQAFEKILRYVAK